MRKLQILNLFNAIITNSILLAFLNGIFFTPDSGDLGLTVNTPPVPLVNAEASLIAEL